MPVIFLIIAFFLNAVANVLLKIGAQREIRPAGMNFFELIGHNYFLILGFFLFALNAGFYFLALRLIPISVAYPIMVAMSLLIINTFAYFYFHESIGCLQIIGYALIIAGIMLISRLK